MGDRSTLRSMATRTADGHPRQSLHPLIDASHQGAHKRTVPVVASRHGHSANTRHEETLKNRISIVLYCIPQIPCDRAYYMVQAASRHRPRARERMFISPSCLMEVIKQAVPHRQCEQALVHTCMASAYKIGFASTREALRRGQWSRASKQNHRQSR